MNISPTFLYHISNLWQASNAFANGDLVISKTRDSFDPWQSLHSFIQNYLHWCQIKNAFGSLPQPPPRSLTWTSSSGLIPNSVPWWRTFCLTGFHSGQGAQWRIWGIQTILTKTASQCPIPKFYRIACIDCSTLRDLCVHHVRPTCLQNRVHATVSVTGAWGFAMFMWSLVPLTPKLCHCISLE